jgi:16S rRNA (guanine527-N7)-methyltransferase
MKLGSDEWKNFIHSGAKVLGGCLDREQIDQFAIHALELQKWNLKINLTSVTDPQEMAVKHFLDSIAAAPMIPKGSRVLDIGSGGGFPGLPLKIMMPSLSMTLIDGSRKKVHFLKHVIRTLRLDQIEALHVRAEDLGKTCDEKYDIVICRALSSLRKIEQLALPLTKRDGMILSLKGKTQEAELAELPAFPQTPVKPEGHHEKGMAVSIKRYTLPFSPFERSIISIRPQPEPK